MGWMNTSSFYQEGVHAKCCSLGLPCSRIYHMREMRVVMVMYFQSKGS